MVVVDTFMRVLGPVMLLCLFVAGCGDGWEPASETRVQPRASDDVTRAAPESKGASEPPNSVSLRWTGCDISKKAYLNEAVAAYEKAAGIKIIVTGGGATRGIRATAGGMADMGGSCRHSLPDQFPEQEKGARLTHVAWDALVFFTHPTNPVNSLTRDQARKILLGEIRNWKAVGGPDAEIIPAFRQQTVTGKLSGVGYMTRLMLFDDPQVDYRSDAIFHTSSGPIEKFVESTQFSFAVTGVSSARKRKVKILALDGVQPREKGNIQTGAYPLARPLYLVTRGEPTGPLKAFIDWILGAEGQAVLSAAGTVNLAEGAALKDLFQHWPADTGIIRNY